jgi:hypothetical protein
MDIARITSERTWEHPFFEKIKATRGSPHASAKSFWKIKDFYILHFNFIHW